MAETFPNIGSYDGPPPYAMAPRAGLGLAPIDMAHWLVPDDQADFMPQKRILLADPTRYAQTEDAAAALDELAQRLMAIGLTPQSAHIKDIAACISDDPIILLPHQDSFKVVAASLCAPTFFDVADVIGRGLAPIHAPVPDEGGNRAARIARVFANLDANTCLERFNWTVQWSAARCTSSGEPLRALAQAADESAAMTEMFERVERQTIVRLAPTNAILFAIRVRLTPLSHRLAHPQYGPAFAAAWRNLPPAISAYKKLAVYERHVASMLRLAGL